MLHKGRRGEAGGEEDVDIGDEMPMSNYPPVEIERDARSNTSSSSSSSSDSSSSSGNFCFWPLVFSALVANAFHVGLIELCILQGQILGVPLGAIPRRTVFNRLLLVPKEPTEHERKCFLFWLKIWDPRENGSVEVPWLMEESILLGCVGVE